MAAQMKLTIVFLAAAVAVAAGQNFYLHFANPKSESIHRFNEPNQIAAGFYSPAEVTFYNHSFHQSLKKKISKPSSDFRTWILNPLELVETKLK